MMVLRFPQMTVTAGGRFASIALFSNRQVMSFSSSFISHFLCYPYFLCYFNCCN